MMANKKVYTERYVLGLQNKIDLLHVACDNGWACAGQRGAETKELQVANDELRKQLQDLREVADGLEKRADAEAKRVVVLEADLNQAWGELADKKRESRADRLVIVELARDVSSLRGQIRWTELGLPVRTRSAEDDHISDTGKKEWDDESHRAIRHGQDIR